MCDKKIKIAILLSFLCILLYALITLLTVRFSFNCLILIRGLLLILSFISCLILLKFFFIPYMARAVKNLVRVYMREGVRKRVFKVVLTVFCVSTLILIFIALFAFFFLDISSIEYDYEVGFDNGGYYYKDTNDNIVHVNSVAFHIYFHFLKYLLIIVKILITFSFFYLFFFHLVPYFFTRY